MTNETTDRKLRILVVDDNEDAATSLCYLLGIAGFEVSFAHDGPTALSVAAGFRPDACVLDINMPGMTGYELAEQLRELMPDHPPLFATVTAYDSDDHLQRAASVGFDLHFTKPANPFEVAEQLIERLGEKTAVPA